MSVEPSVFAVFVSFSEKAKNFRFVEAIQEACTNRLHVSFDHRSVELPREGTCRDPGRHLQGRSSFSILGEDGSLANPPCDQTLTADLSPRHQCTSTRAFVQTRFSSAIICREKDYLESPISSFELGFKHMDVISGKTSAQCGAI